MNEDGPAGWATALLPEFTENLDGRRIPVNAEERASRTGPFPYYGANGQAGTIDDYLFDGDYVLLAEDGGYFDDLARRVAYRATGKFWVNNHAHILRGLGGVEASFLAHVLNAADWMPHVSGTTRLKLTQAAMNRASLPLPPLPEQRRIVAKLDALNERSRRAKAALDAIPPLVEKFKQSVLAAAFRGDLTADWRAKNPDVEPASELLKRIRVERRRRWEEAELAKMKAKGKTPGDDRWMAKYEEPEPVDESELSELPEGWCWAGLEELRSGDAPLVYGIILPGEDVASGVPYVRPIDIGDDGSVDVETLKRASKKVAQQYARSSLKAGDVVLSIVGTIGKVTVASEALEGANITQSSIRLRPGSGTSSPYLRRLLQAPILVRQYDMYRFGNAVQRLNVEHVRQLVVPLAPMEEQPLVVASIENAMAALERSPMASLSAAIGKLERAVLAKAFRGALVPQDPNDEPASMLLERIRAEREKANGETKANGSTARSGRRGEKPRKASRGGREAG